MTLFSSDHAARSGPVAVPSAAPTLPITVTTPSGTSAPPLPPVTLATARRRNPQQSAPSPCVGVCKMDAAQGWCTGCFRTLDEIAAWGRATDAAKLAVWSLVEARQA